MKIHHVTLFVAFNLIQSQAQFAPMAYPQSMPMGMPAMPMQMPIMGPPRMPMVVMPYHSRTADNFRKIPKTRKQRPRQYESSDSSSSSSESSSSSSSSSSSDELSLRNNKSDLKKRRQVLTPVVSYVTKDGYVVYQKKIKKDRAKDWLDLGKSSDDDVGKTYKDSDTDSNELQDSLKKKLAKIKRKHHKSSKKSKHKHHRKN